MLQSEIKIDPEFRDYMPAVANDDLEQVIIRDGCLDDLIIWKGQGLLVDGHRRYAICNKHKLDFHFREMEFADRDAVLNFIDELAVARRNLSPDEMSLRRGRIYNRLKKAQGGTGANQHSQTDQTDLSANTAERLAEKHNVSAPTIKRDGQFAAAVDKLKTADPELPKKIAAGTAPPKKAIIEAAKAPTPAAAKASLMPSPPRPRPAPAAPRPVKLPAWNKLPQLNGIIGRLEKLATVPAYQFSQAALQLVVTELKQELERVLTGERS